jgi:hypothetical protein
MCLGRPSCSGSPFLADWTRCAGWIGGAVSRASACSLAALDQLPAAERCNLVGKNRRGRAFFFLLLSWASSLRRHHMSAAGTGVQTSIPCLQATNYLLAA